ncbi:PIN domain-containing protein [Alloscardovia venturai]|uniref:PIN domain-containing protein n=1 Tax=Alloscardovia venturai TaxID=1769421 RepID=A0ABW2Y2W8_9BIFI
MTKHIFLDTCVLYSETLTDIILRLADNGIVTPRWSQKVLDELAKNLTKAMTPTHINYRIRQMSLSFPDALIENYETSIPLVHSSIEDKHVMAAVLSTPERNLITFNLKDFPTHEYPDCKVHVYHPDDFLVEMFEAHANDMTTLCLTALSEYKEFPKTIDEFIFVLEKSRVPLFAQAIKSIL